MREPVSSEWHVILNMSAPVAVAVIPCPAILEKGRAVPGNLANNRDDTSEGGKDATFLK